MAGPRPEIRLVTGITGSLGRAYLEHSRYEGRIRGLSRDEGKQGVLRAILGSDSGVQLVLGDVRDPAKLEIAMLGAQTVLHACALKQIPCGAYNPDEFLLTNGVGTLNVIRAAIHAGVERVLVVSSDKACENWNMYGATKAVAEHLAIEANAWSPTKISVVRYGNVEGSRGSFTNDLARADGVTPLTVTDPECTRFWITLPQAVAFIDMVFEEMAGGEIFVPRLPARRLGDMLPAGHPVEYTGLRKTEKLHETLITMDEVGRTDVKGEYCVIRPWPYRGNCLAQAPLRSDGDVASWGSD